MAPQNEGPSEVTFLKAVTLRINATPAEQLPHCIPDLTGYLVSCRQVLSSEAKQNTSEANDELNKLKTRLSTLLQDRTAQGRWAAIVLVKCVIQLGGWEVLQNCKPWVKNLLKILTKPDPPTTKKLAIITLTRIFYLSKQYQTLVREVVTDGVKESVTSCMNLVFPKTISSVDQHTAAQRALLATVLDSFATLLPRHPTIFRPFLTQISILLSQCIAPTSTTKKCSVPPIDAEIVTGARKLFVLLHFSAPKDKGPEEWYTSFDNTIKSAHSVADRVFRSVIEAWQSSTGRQSSVTAASYSEEIRETGGGLLNLPPWAGIHAGSENLVGLLRVLKQFVVSNTTAPVDFRIGLVADLLSRILSLAVPFGRSANWEDGIQYNPQIGKDERNALFTLLPGIHAAAMEVLLALVARFEGACMPFAHILLEEVVGIFDAEKDVPLIRVGAYMATAALVKIVGQSLTKPTVASLSPALRYACHDLLLQAAKLSSTAGLEKGHTNGSTKQNGATTNHSQISEEVTFPGLRSAASNFLSTYLLFVPADPMPGKVRSEIERVAVLLGDRIILFASIINPRKPHKKVTSSLLPLVARLFPDDPAIEVFIRPRMPVIQHRVDREALDDEEDENGDNEEDDETDNDEEEEDEAESADEPEDANMADQAAPIEPRHPKLAPSDIVVGAAGVVPPLAVESANTKRPAAAFLEQSSKVKRSRIEDEPTLIVAPSASFTSDGSTLPAAVPVPVPAPVATQSTKLPVLPTKGAVDSDDSEDGDYGELVIGQDTDDEDM